jgi:hypothetical protein
MEIKIEKLKKLTEQAGKIFITPDGEKVLLQLLDLQDQVEAAIDEAEKTLETEALKIDPNFKSLQSDKVKVYYRAYGPKYKVDPSLLDQIPEGLYNRSVKYNANSSAIEVWAKEHAGMPLGIIEKSESERPKSLKFSRK